jgi:hypothetical protein
LLPYLTALAEMFSRLPIGGFFVLTRANVVAIFSSDVGTTALVSAMTRCQDGHLCMMLELDTTMPVRPFHAWRRNVHSQTGEDGIIEQLLTMAKVTSRYFVEFGAWDGRHLSNCAKLADEGWAGCFIEGDATRFVDLKKNYASRNDIVPVNAFVNDSGENRLDAILDRANAPRDIGVLSIDIDGCDYHVWRSVETHLPALCVIEFNPTIPAHVIYVQDGDFNIHRGCSLAALARLGLEKGYALVAATDWNGFFMPQAICETHGIATYTPAEIKDRTYEAAIFHGYDGALLVAGHRQLLWHGVAYGPEELQILPAPLRSFLANAPDSLGAEMARFRKSRET